MKFTTVETNMCTTIFKQDYLDDSLNGRLMDTKSKNVITM